MKKRLLGLLLMSMLIGGMSIVNASDTSCWSGYGGTPPATTYASGILYGCDENDIPIISIYGDGGKGITIKAMNEGATVIGAKNVNTGSYGYHYQWGNNHGFESCYSNNCKTFPLGESKENAQVKVANYGPVGKSVSGYYDSGTWIKQTQWSTDNRNLWGGSGDEKNLNGFWGYDTTNFVVINTGDRQAMCPNGYHIPSIGEWNTLLYLWGKNYDANQGTSLFTSWSLNGLNLNSLNYNYSLNETGNRFSEDMQMPFVGARHYDGTVSANGYGNYWSSSPNGNANNARYFYLYPNYLTADSYSNRGVGYAVRCFKNSYIPLPKTLNLVFMSDGEEVGTGEVSENMTGAVPEEAKNVTKTGYVLEYRYLSGADASTGFDFENESITGGMADDSGNVYFIAKLTPIDYVITYNLDGGTNSDDNPDTYTIESNEITLKEPTKDNHTFEGRYTDAGFTAKITSISTGSTGNITLYAKWKKKSSNRSGGGSSGGGGSNKTGDTQESSSTPQNNSSVSSGTDVKDIEGNTQDSSAEPQNDVTPLTGGDGEARGGYSQEFLNAYERAFKNGITTMNTIDKANMDGYIKRGHLAKMVVNYVTNVLGREIPSDIPDECLSWTDTYRESDEIKDYATKSCALGLMGINMKNNEFLPNDYVPRSQFGAVLSRILRGDKYNLVGTADKPRYSDHLNALKEEGIMTKIDNPKMQEKRGYVMIMLIRSAKGK